MLPRPASPCDFPISARLYLPEVWTEDRSRCHRRRVPERVTFASKPELALHLLDRATSWGVPFAIVVTDAGSCIPRFLRALDEVGLLYVCAVASDFGVRLPNEMQQAEALQAEIVPRKRGQPKKPRPVRRHDAQAVTQAQPEEAWKAVEWREGSRGPLRKQFVALRVHAGTGCARHNETHGRSWTGEEGWLIGEHPLSDEEGEPKWFFSSLPAETTLSRLVELAHLRWPIEQFYEDAKGECGLDQLQGRSWDGLHRHLALVMLASTFLMLQSLGQRESAAPASEAAFPPARQISLPACHQQMLVRLFQDLVLWLMETDQVKAFRPRRNEQRSGNAIAQPRQINATVRQRIPQWLRRLLLVIEEYRRRALGTSASR